MELGTNPNLRDTDGDGLNDRWESEYSYVVETPSGEVTLLDPLDGNWDCYLLTPEVKGQIQNDIGSSEWDEMGASLATPATLSSTWSSLSRTASGTSRGEV
ncbi:MAG: hypothetical protein CM1200mP32_01030 [Methanobacteriota archaeon]|nr:MAG: hypothetical protein CM1200mP32_01030 [Euryarchaeota archaeon]